MCSNPINLGDVVVACRSCDDCVETRINNWVYRAVAESSIAGHTYSFTLTYRDLPSGEMPVGAMVFNYSDIQRFFKSLRDAYLRHYKAVGELRYIVCGEQGSQGTKRVHWHVVVYSDQDLMPLGKWVDDTNSHVVKHSDVSPDTRYRWSFWPHGHLLFQIPNERGIRYALKYALKDQLGVSKSEGTNRYYKAQVWAASYFRMSKKPPIGFRFLRQQCDLAAAGGWVFPSFSLRVPGTNGFWFLSGKFAEYFAQRMSDINRTHIRVNGYPCHGFSSLYASIVAFDDAHGFSKIREVFDCVSQGTEQAASPEGVGPIAGFGEEYEASRQQAERRAQYRLRSVVSRCGGFGPCSGCFNALKHFDPEEYDRAIFARDEVIKRHIAAEGFRGVSVAPWDDVAEESYFFKASDVSRFESYWRRNHTVCSGWCALRTNPEVVQAFKRYESLARLSASCGGYQAEYSAGVGASGGKPRGL